MTFPDIAVRTGSEARPRAAFARTVARGLAVVLVFVLMPSRLFAAPVVIDFESFLEGDPVGTVDIATFIDALVLTEGSSLNEFELPPHSSPNVAIDVGGPLRINFSAPIQSFLGFFTYATPLTIQAFDGANNQIGNDTSTFASNLALSGDVGSLPNELLQITVAGIRSILITGGPNGESFVVDDIEFDRGQRQVPEPATLLLCGVVAVTLRQRVRRALTSRL